MLFFECEVYCWDYYLVVIDYLILNMDSLCQDLQRTIYTFLKVSQLIFLNVETKDNEVYLDLILISDRYNLALKNENIAWILETIDKSEQLTTQYTVIQGITTSKELHLDYYSLCHYYGKKGKSIERFSRSDLDLMQINIGMLYYVGGLAIGQHYDLFDKYFQRLNPDVLRRVMYTQYFRDLIYVGYQTYCMYKDHNITRFILSFDDEEQIIVKIKSLCLHCNDSVRRILFEGLFNKKKYKAVSYLLTTTDMLDSEMLDIFVDNNAISMLDQNKFLQDIEHYLLNSNKHSYEILIIKMCLLGSTDALKIAIKCIRNNQEFFDIIKEYYLDMNVYNYILKNHDQTFKNKNKEFLETIKMLRPYFKVSELRAQYNGVYRTIIELLIQSMVYHMEKSTVSYVKKMISTIVESGIFELKDLLSQCRVRSTTGKSSFIYIFNKIITYNIMELKGVAGKLNISGYNKMFSSELLYNIIMNIY